MTARLPATVSLVLAVTLLAMVAPSLSAAGAVDLHEGTLDIRGSFGPGYGVPEDHPFFLPAGTTRLVMTVWWNTTWGFADLDAVLIAPTWCPEPLFPDSTGIFSAASCPDLLGVPRESPGWFRSDAGTPMAPDEPSTLIVEGAEREANDVCPAEPCRWSAAIFQKSAGAGAYHIRLAAIRA